MTEIKARKAAKNALEYVLETAVGESVLIVCDYEKKDVGIAFAEGALALGPWTRMITLEPPEKVRTDIPPQLCEVLSQKRPDVYINLMRKIREETPFRIQVIKMQTRDRRARLGHCPGVTLDMLTEGALALTAEEHRSMQRFAGKVMQALDEVVRIEITNPSGSELTFSTEGREFYTDTRFDWNLWKWMNLPTGEVIVAPVENSLEGELVCDLAIGGIGPLKTPLEITAKNGKIQDVESQDEDVLKKVKDTLNTDEWSDLVGEFAFGINPKARFTEEFLEAEKMLGTIHVAFGHNLDMPGGKNPSKNHMDFLISKPTVRITKMDDSTVPILEEGKFKL